MSDSLQNLLDDGIIDAVLGQLKSGKEAEVWLVEHRGEVLAAKIYKERHERNFRNNAGYREGREVRNSRTRRAMEKGSKFGQAAAEEAWKSAEADSLFKLHAQGIRVPTPVMFYEGILLMELVIDPDGHPAPRLVEAPPQTPDEARAMYFDLRSQVVGMLCADLIHGDLSAYNILCAWNGPVIIDFPQTLAAARNSQAEFYFRRDLDNVRNFLAGVDSSLYGMAGDTGEIWNAYTRRELTADFVPSGRESRRGPPPRAPREDRPRQRERSEAPPAIASHVPPAATGSQELDPVEVELRLLEATLLRQGGGSRPKPPSSNKGRDQRGGRPFGRGPGRPGGGRPPQQSGAGAPNRGGRPPQQGSAPAGAPSRGGGQPQPSPGNRQGAPAGRNGNGPRTPQKGASAPRDGGRPQQQGGAPPQRNGGNRQGAPGSRNGPRPAQKGAPAPTSAPRDGGRPQQPSGGPPRDGGNRSGSGGAGRSRGGGRPQQRSSGPQVSYVSRPPNRGPGGTGGA